MIQKLVESAGGTAGDAYARATFGIAGIYWLCAGLVYATWHGFANTSADIIKLPQATQIVLVIVGAAVLLVTSAAVDSLVFPVLRLLEGYGRFWPLKKAATGYQIAQRDRLLKRWATIAQVATLPQPTPEQTTEYVEVDTLLRRYPDAIGDFMPTALGNILRASERRPLARYGLDSVPVWTQLWLVATDDVRAEVIATRMTLDNAVRAWIWSLLFVPWAVLFVAGGRWLTAAVIVILGFGCAWLSYLRACHAAVPFCATVEAAFDVSRNALYKTLRLPLPRTAAEERALGAATTAFLYNSFTENLPDYVPAESEPQPGS